MQKKTVAMAENNASYREFLKSVSLFSGLSDGDHDTILANARIKDYKKGEQLFLVGDSAKRFYVIICGGVKLFRETRDGHEIVMALFAPGDFFGKAATFGNASYPYNAEITDDSTIMEIPATFLMTLLESNDTLGTLFLELMRSRFDNINELGLRAEHLAVMTSAQRVGCFLLRMCREQHEGRITLQLPHKKVLIAAYLGMEQETFSRSLHQLTATDVETDLSRITINDINQLRSYVCSHCSALEEECPLAKYSDSF